MDIMQAVLRQMRPPLLDWLPLYTTHTLVSV
jgi:hypothetical protein